MTEPVASRASDAPPVPDVLAAICAATRQEVARRSAAMPLREVKARSSDQGPTRGFGLALKATTARREVGLIAEMKQRSPSGGSIRPIYDPAVIARAYQSAGAACLSVLTEEMSFGGRIEDLRAARDAVALPVLRKDFILEPWQVYESRMIGADCILLIMAALSDGMAAELLSLARSLDMDVLVEAHDAAELNRALGLNTDLVGINNRNLKTLRTDLATTLALAPTVPPDRIVVAESGIRTRDDVLRLAGAGASCFLVGESLLREPDPGVACAALLGSLHNDVAT